MRKQIKVSLPSTEIVMRASNHSDHYQTIILVSFMWLCFFFEASEVPGTAGRLFHDPEPDSEESTLRDILR
jgi:hypothetical protein